MPLLNIHIEKSPNCGKNITTPYSCFLFFYRRTCMYNLYKLHVSRRGNSYTYDAQICLMGWEIFYRSSDIHTYDYYGR
jgi:hypothetical protein